jgi:hypothetical protein
MSFDDNKQLYNTLNNLFPNDDIIDDVKHFIRTKKYPDNLNTKQKEKRFYEKYKDFIIKDGSKLVFKPLDLVVVPKSEASNVLQKVYTKDDAGLGKAILTLYRYVREKYINITRKQVKDFIKGQTNYQLTKDFAHRINKPIIAKYPNQIWCMDLIDLNGFKTENKGYRYIMTVVDVFSRKVWLEKLKMKFSFNARDALKRTIQRAEVSPGHIISDGGSEFIGEAMAKYCKENKIGQRVTRTYAPQANGIVERMNRSVRKLLRAYFAKNENKVWYNLLPNIEENKNGTYHSVIKTTPQKIWTPNKQHLRTSDDFSDEEILNEDKLKVKARNNVLKKVKADIKRFKDKELNIGDFVRIKMTAISSNLRRLEKNDMTKQTIIRWTPMIFRVVKKVTPKEATLERSRYFVVDLQGRYLYVKRQTNRAGNSDVYTKKQFYQSDLLHIPSDENNTTMTLKKAMKLNGVEPNLNDLTFLNEVDDDNVPRQEQPRKRKGGDDDDDDNDDDHLPQPKTRSQTNVQYEPNYWVEEEPPKASKPRKKRAKYTPEPDPPKVPKPRKKKAKYTPVPVEEEEGYW